MPCCAFAACIVAQLILGVRAVKRALFGGAADAFTARNSAVEWRLDSAAATSVDVASPSLAWLRDRRSLRFLVLAAGFEVVIVVGAIYGVVEHLGHGGAAHSGHAHRAESIAAHGPIDANAPAPSRGNVRAVRD